MKIIRIIILVGCLLAGIGEAAAQQITIVSGKILNLQDGKKKPEPFPFGETVEVYAFNTVAAAEDAKKVAESTGGFMNSDAVTKAGADGYYEINVAETGALLVRVVNAMKYEIFEVNYQKEISRTISTDRTIDEVVVQAARLVPDPEPEASEIEGNNLYIKNSFPIPQQFCKPNSRLIIQPYVINCKTKDTVTFARPIILTGDEYMQTQERRMLYEMEHDPLVAHENQHSGLKESFNDAIRFDLPYSDTVYIADPTTNYTTFSLMLLEDYNNIEYEKINLLTTCETRRPLNFLETAFPPMNVNPMDYKVQPRRERRDTKGSIQLGFLVGRAQLDPENPMNEEQLNKMHNELGSMMADPSITLKTFKITGVSSPEGRYASNLALAKQRTDFAYNAITSVIPQRTMRTIFTSRDTRVAGWDEVADLLESDTLPNEAAEIRAIVEKYPKSVDAQSAAIARLPYYKTIIKDRLPRLRTVQYEYTYELFRELDPAEILHRYETDEEYRNGTKTFTLYEYWHLFQQVKDKKELEALYKRACEDSKSSFYGKPWVLAANNLAVAYLERDTCDIELLEPLIDLGVQKVNLKTVFEGQESIINPEEVVINHLAMCIKAHNFRKASVLAQILPDDPKYEKVRAFARCLGGYYKGGSTVEEANERKKIFEIVKNSTPLNAVVMCLAMKQGHYDNEAMTLLEKLPKDEALTWYLKGVAAKRIQGDGAIDEAWMEYFSYPKDKTSPPYAGKNAVGCLIQAFVMDPELFEYAASDGDIGEKFFNEVVAIWEEVKASGF